MATKADLVKFARDNNLILNENGAARVERNNGNCPCSGGTCVCENVMEMISRRGYCHCRTFYAKGDK